LSILLRSHGVGGVGFFRLPDLAAFPSSQTWSFVHSPSNRRNNPFSLPLSSNQNRGYQNYGDCKKNYTPAPFITRRNIFAGASGLTACDSIFPTLETTHEHPHQRRPCLPERRRPQELRAKDPLWVSGLFVVCLSRSSD
jgi:hypothetical protein